MCPLVERNPAVVRVAAPHRTVANSVKGPGVALKMNWPNVMKRSRGVNPAAADCAGAIAMYFSPQGPRPGIVPNTVTIPVAVDRIDVRCCNVFGREQISLVQRPRLWAWGETW